MNKFFNTAQLLVLVTDLKDEVDFDLINKEFNQLTYKENVNNKVSIDMNFFDKPGFENTKNSLIKNCENFLNSSYGIGDYYSGLKITHSWGNITEPGASHHEHMHPFSVVSGVIYLDNNPCNLNLHIEGHAPTIPYFIHQKYVYVSLNSLLKDAGIDNDEVNNLQNHLVLFLSNQHHLVSPTNESDSPRRSIAFNTFWEGGTGVKGEPLAYLDFR